MIHNLKTRQPKIAFTANLNPCPGSSGVEQWTENPRVGGSNPPPGTTQIKQVSYFIYLNELSIIYIHLNTHLLPLVPPPNILDYCRVRYLYRPMHSRLLSSAVKLAG